MAQSKASQAIPPVLEDAGVVIEASRLCKTTRSVHKPDSDFVTSLMLGCFRDNPELRQEFLSMTA